MIKRFTHLGIAVHDLDAAVMAWSEQFGLEVLHRLDVAIEGLRTVVLGSPHDPGGFCVELLSPLVPDDPSNQVVRFLAKRGEGLFHLAAAVDETADRVIVAPRSANGVLVELLQARS
jgi:catechol 2,3-dioxygenase-like lactoylglutathione lyase family enzyme